MLADILRLQAEAAFVAADKAMDTIVTLYCRASYFTTLFRVIWELCSPQTAHVLTMPMQPSLDDNALRESFAICCIGVYSVIMVSDILSAVSVYYWGLLHDYEAPVDFLTSFDCPLLRTACMEKHGCHVMCHHHHTLNCASVLASLFSGILEIACDVGMQPTSADNV